MMDACDEMKWDDDRSAAKCETRKRKSLNRLLR